MRIVCGTLVLTLGFTVACASRSTTATTTTTAQAGVTAGRGGTAAPARANTDGAQAAALLTVRDLEARMKNIGTTYPSMRKNLMAKMLPEAAKEAQQLAVWFGDVERFWAQHKKADAVKWAQTARMFATEVAGTAAAGDAMKAEQAAVNMQGMCKQCHGTYREMDPAGGFRIKPGVVVE